MNTRFVQRKYSCIAVIVTKAIKIYKGYPTGYLIIWKNPNVKLKDGSISAGKKILIDGQQRVTALMTSNGIWCYAHSGACGERAGGFNGQGVENGRCGETALRMEQVKFITMINGGRENKTPCRRFTL